MPNPRTLVGRLLQKIQKLSGTSTPPQPEDARQVLQGETDRLQDVLDALLQDAGKLPPGDGRDRLLLAARGLRDKLQGAQGQDAATLSQTLMRLAEDAKRVRGALEQASSQAPQGDKSPSSPEPVDRAPSMQAAGDFKNRLTGLIDAIKKATAEGGPRGTEVARLNAEAVNAAKGKRFDEAMQSLDALELALGTEGGKDKAFGSGPQEDPQGQTMPPPKPSDKLLAARQEVRQFLASLGTQKAQWLSEMGALPPPLASSLQAIESLLDGEGDLDHLTAQLERAGNEAQKLEKDVNQHLAQRREFDRNAALLEGRINAMETHPKATVDFVARQIVDIRKALADARTKAAEQSAQADKDLLVVAQSCLDTETVADRHAKYHVILAHRRKLVQDLGTPVPAKPLEQVNAHKKTLKDAEDAAGRNEFELAVQLLDTLPKACMDTAWLIKQANKYAGEHQSVKESVDKLIGKKGDVPEIAKRIDDLKVEFDLAHIDEAKDYEVAMARLKRVDSQADQLREHAKAHKVYVAKRKEAADIIDALAAHDGAAGIQAEVQRLRDDLSQADIHRQADEFLTAMSMCAEIIKQDAELTQHADDHKDYLDERDIVETKHGNLPPEAAQAASDVLGQYTALMQAAAQHAIDRAYDAAKEALEDADACLDQAQTLGSNAQLMQQWDAAVGASAPNANFNAAYGTFQQILTEARNHDADSAFDDVLNGAEQAGIGAQQQAPNDEAGALQALDGAVKTCLATVLDVDRRNACQTLKARVEGHLNDLKNTDAVQDGLLGNETTTTDTDLVTVDTQITQRQFDTVTSTLTTCQERLSEARQNARLYDEFQSLRDGNVQTCINSLDVPAVRVALDTEVNDFLQAVGDAENERSQEQFQQALDALKKQDAIGDDLWDIYLEYKEAHKARQEEVLDVVTAIDNKPLVAANRAAIQTMQDRLEEMFQERQFEQAYNYASTTINWAIELATAKLKRHEDHVTLRKTATDAIDALKLKACDAVRDDIKTVDSFLSKADTQAQDDNTEVAAKHLASVLEFCGRAQPVADAYALYAPVLADVQGELDKMTKEFSGLDAVALRLSACHAQVKLAQASAQRKAFDDGRTLLETLQQTLPGIRQAAAAQKAVGDTAERVQQMSGGASPGAVRQELAALQQAHDGVAGREGVASLQALLAREQKLLTQVGALLDKPDVAQAVMVLKEAASNVNHTLDMADQLQPLAVRLKAARDRVAEIRQTHAEPALLHTLLDGQLKALDLVQQDIDGQVFSSALQELQLVEAELQRLNLYGQQQARYKAERQTVAQRLDALAAHEARHAVAKELGEARAYALEADQMTAQRDFVEAHKLLDGAVALCDDALLKVKISANEVPSDDDIKALLKKPDGDKRLDAIFKTLDPIAQRKACQKAFELRFDIQFKIFSDEDAKNEVTDMEAQALDIQRLYEIMAKLPKGHTKDNPSMAKVHKLTEKLGSSAYSKYSREVELSVGRALGKDKEMIAQDWETGEVDDNAKPTDNNPPNAYTWHTLHEIAHSLDDRKKFMATHGSGAAYGGWKEYGADVSEIARVAAAHFNFTGTEAESYVASYLSGSVKAAPAASGGVTPEEWHRRKVAVQSWCDSIRSDKSIYYNAALTAKLQIGGRVYQEAYGNRWVSYDFSARRKAVCGYQFRAPGEWFAELYASFHSGKMNAEHPARSWLETL